MLDPENWNVWGSWKVYRGCGELLELLGDSEVCCDGPDVLAKRRGDSVSNPLVGYIFGWYDRIVVCPRCAF